MYQHPKKFITVQQAGFIREQAPFAETLTMLTAELLQLVHAEGWFKRAVPRVYGGSEMALPDLLRFEEGLSWADGSLGWVVTLCAGAGWFGGFLNPELANTVLAHPKLCIAGSGASTGTAEASGTGYFINGFWKYASGVHHASHITINCRVTRGGRPQTDAEGLPLIKSFIVKRSDVQLHQGWKYIGMVATGSDAYEISNLRVEAEQAFELTPTGAVVQTQLYRYPFLQLAEATLAVNLSGMAVHFADLAREAFNQKTDAGNLKSVQVHEMETAYHQQVTRLHSCRSQLYQAVEASWATPANQQMLQAVSKASRTLAVVARQCTDVLYPYCGLKAAAPDTEINRVWRDLHTASQHSLLTFQQ